MFTRKPQTALTAKKTMQRSHTREKQTTTCAPAVLQPANGFANVNGVLLPF